MIKPAQLYRQELNSEYFKVFYDFKYMYYTGYPGAGGITIPDNTYDSHHFAILNSKNEIVGYIAYSINFASKVVDKFGIISFKQSACFGRDLLKIIDDIFVEYNMNKIEFIAFEDNPIIKHYYKFINEYGGNIVGILHDSGMLQDGKLHNAVIFELFRENYIKNRPTRLHGLYSKKTKE